MVTHGGHTQVITYLLTIDPNFLGRPSGATLVKDVCCGFPHGNPKELGESGVHPASNKGSYRSLNV